MRIESGGAPPLDIQGDALGPLRRQGEFQLAAKGVPVVFAGILPAPEPFQPVGDMADFVAVDFIQQFRGGGVADGGEALREVAGKIQVGLLEGEAQAGDVFHRVLHPGDRAPEIAAHRQLTEVDAALLHAMEVKLGVFLFVLQGLIEALAECGGGLGKFQEHQRHQFRSQQFVVGKEMKQFPAFGFLLQIFCAGKGVAGGAGRLELQFCGAPRAGGRDERRAGAFIGDLGRAQEFFLQRRGEQDPLGKFSEFHERERA